MSRSTDKAGTVNSVIAQGGWKKALCSDKSFK